MADASTHPVATALAALLERERACILAGEIDKLTRLLPEKERLLNGLKTLNGNAPAVEHLRRQADRNQHLLAASARGIRSAQMRLNALMTAQSELRTYTREGRARDLSKRESRFERKA